MGLAHRIVPVILCKGRMQVKGRQFNSWRSVGIAEQAMRVHAMRQVDEVVLLDIAATKEGRTIDLGLVESLAQSLYTPLAVGGGVRSIEDVRALLKAGADKVVIGAAAFLQDDFLGQCTDIVGSQAIVASVDVKGNGVFVNAGSMQAFANAESAAESVAAEGAGEILLTSIEREGMMCGYDLDLIRRVSDAVDIPVIAHGGCGSYQHMVEAIQAGAHAVAAGAFFQFCDASPLEAARFLQSNGIETRIPC